MNTGPTPPCALTPSNSDQPKAAPSTGFCFSRSIGTDRDERGTAGNVAKRFFSLSPTQAEVA